MDLCPTFFCHSCLLQSNTIPLGYQHIRISNPTTFLDLGRFTSSAMHVYPCVVVRTSCCVCVPQRVSNFEPFFSPQVHSLLLEEFGFLHLTGKQQKLF